MKLLNDPSEYIRAWAIQLLAEDRNPSPAVMAEFVKDAQLMIHRPWCVSF